MTASITHGVPFADYIRIQAVNWSTLKEMGKSPRHYLHRLGHQRGDSPTFALGRAAHTAILEPDRLLLDYAVFEGPRRAGKIWDAFEEANASKTILKLDEYSEALTIRDAVRSHPLVARYLAKGQREVTITWTDEATGLVAKGRVDWLADVDGAIYLIDLKTARDIEMRVFGGAAARLSYHAQLAWYMRGLKENGVLVAGALIVAVENDAPYDVGVFTLDDETLFAGDEQCGELLSRVRGCLDRGEWAGQYLVEEPLQLPAWWYAQEEDEAGLGVTIHRGG